MKNKIAGFSLIELMVSISVIAILTSVGYVSFQDSTKASRDTERRSDLRTLQSAIELYKNDHGRYPAGCNGPDVWSGQSDSSYACSSGGQYIVDLAPKYIPTLPTDPKPLPSSNAGFVYTVNDVGTVYKIMAKNTIENDFITRDKPGSARVTAMNNKFKSCDITNRVDGGLCDQLYGATGNAENVATPSWCLPGNDQFETSYGLWGGYANVSPTAYNADIQVERQTENIICEVQ